jgi:hypothetical protein
MKMLAVLAFLLGVLAWLSFRTPERDTATASGAVSLNYVLYRKAAIDYALEHPFPEGDIPASALALPSGWLALRDWRARIDGGRCFVWGPASAWEIDAAKRLLWGSWAVGRAENGRLVPGNGAVIPIPAYVGNGNIVSVIKVD